MINWIKTRMKERTTWDGGVLIALGLMILFLAPLRRLHLDLQLHMVFGLFGNLNNRKVDYD